MLWLRTVRLGIKSLATFHWKEFEFSLGNRFLYAGNKAKDTELSDDFRSFETGFDINHPLGFDIGGREADFSVYFINLLYANLQFLRFEADAFRVDVQYEAGFTLGFRKPSKLWILFLSRAASMIEGG